MTGAAAARRLSNWHRFIVGIAVSAGIVGTTALGAFAAAIAIRSCRDIIAAAASRGSGEGGTRGGGRGYRGGNDVSVRGRLVLNAVTHPMAVLATGAADPLRISTVPCRSWPRGPFAGIVQSGAPSRWKRAAIPLEATLWHWYRRRVAPPRPKFAVSGFGGGRGCYCCCRRLK